jgi:hypothetical protein
LLPRWYGTSPSDAVASSLFVACAYPLAGQPCNERVAANPTCADGSWVLWEGDFIDPYCCKQGQAGYIDKQQCLASNLAAGIASTEIGSTVSYLNISSSAGLSEKPLLCDKTKIYFVC